MNMINYGIGSYLIWNKTKVAVINSAIEILRIKPRENKKNQFNNICKKAIAERN